MTSLETVLAKRPGEWTDEEWKLVRDAIKDGFLAVDELKKFDFRPPSYQDYTGWGETGGYDNTCLNEQSCMVQKFFQDNPKETTVMIACQCPNCSCYC